MKKSGFSFLCIVMLVSFAFAGQRNTEIGTERELKEKIGVGFNSSVTNTNLPALAGRYWLTDVAGVEGFFGFKINNNLNQNNDYVIGSKFLYVIKSYKNLNVFSAASLALRSGTRVYGIITGGLGIEWFVLDELSLSTEAGLRFMTGNGVTNLETNIENIPRISIKYYL